MTEHVVCDAAELPTGERKIVKIGRASIGVFNVDGELYAVRNICPHHGAQLCLGKVDGSMLPSGPGQWDFSDKTKVVRCPRHRWEFDLSNGLSVTEPERWRVKVYPVRIFEDKVVVDL